MIIIGQGNNYFKVVHRRQMEAVVLFDDTDPQHTVAALGKARQLAEEFGANRDIEVWREDVLKRIPLTGIRRAERDENKTGTEHG